MLCLAICRAKWALAESGRPRRESTEKCVQIFMPFEFKADRLCGAAATGAAQAPCILRCAVYDHGIPKGARKNSPENKLSLELAVVVGGTLRPSIAKICPTFKVVQNNHNRLVCIPTEYKSPRCYRTPTLEKDKKGGKSTDVALRGSTWQ